MSIIVNDLSEALKQYSTSATPTKSSAMQSFMINQNTALQAVATLLNSYEHINLQRLTAYTVGQTVYSPNLPSNHYLVCITAGTTGTTEPTWPTSGNTVTDGTATWTVQEIVNTPSFRNKIINGNFVINQRAVSGTVTLAAGAYGHDRWKAGASGCTYTFATVENKTTITISAGSLVQVIEGINLQSGTHILSWQGTAQGKIGAGSYGASGVTGLAIGGTNMTVEFGTGTLSLVQLESGNIATVFEQRFIGTELSLCQRYYQSNMNTMCNLCFPTESLAHVFYVHPNFCVLMRIPPTVTIYSFNKTVNKIASATGADISPTVSSVLVGINGIRIITLSDNASLTLGAPCLFYFTANAEL